MGVHPSRRWHKGKWASLSAAIGMAGTLMLGGSAIGQGKTPLQNNEETQAQKPTTSAPDLPALVLTQEGQLPIVLSAPHGGKLAIPGATARTGAGLAKGPAGFVTVRDVNTDLLAQALASALEAKLGRKPYYVIAAFSRRYADPNRPAKVAVDSPQAQAVYDAYRGALARYCQDVKRTYGRGLLIDIHGQARARDTIFRGTNNGKTVALLVRERGEAAQSGPQSLAALLTAHGCKIFPTGAEKENPSFTGGNIVQTYGGEHEYGFDAVQLEFGADYTNRSALKTTAAKLADAIAEYAHLYLPEKPLTSPSTPTKPLAPSAKSPAPDRPSTGD